MSAEPKSLPSNLDAERGLLGAVLYRNEAIERCGALAPEHFHEPAHARIFEALRKAVNVGRRADAATLATHFADDETLADLGGARAYFLKLLATAARSGDLCQEYAELIRDLATRRELARVAMEVEALALAPPDGETGRHILARAESAFRAIDAGASRSLILIREAGEAVVRDLGLPTPPGLKTGIPRLDNLMGGLFAPDLIVLAGRPSMGKTSLATNIAFNVAKSDLVSPDGQIIRPRVVVFFSLEMTAPQLAGRALSRLSFSQAGDSFQYSALRSERRPKPGIVAQYLDRLPSALLIDDSSEQTLANIRSRAREVRRRSGAIDLIVVDYLQLMDDPSSRRDGRVQEVSAITKGLKAIAKDFAVPVLALAQLSRQVETRPDKTPQLADLRESGSIEQDADMVLFAYREHYYLIRNEPKPADKEEKAETRARVEHWRNRCEATETQFRAILAKARFGPTGFVDLHCDLGADLITGNILDGAHGEPRHWEN